MFMSDHEISVVREVYLTYEEGRQPGEKLPTLWDPCIHPDVAVRAVWMANADGTKIEITTDPEIVLSLLGDSEHSDVLELTPEMQIPPDPEWKMRLNLWQAEHQRDLVAEVRSSLADALSGGYDALTAHPTDEALARDLHSYADFADVPRDILTAACAQARAIAQPFPQSW
jgi:hypothetical protein